MKSFFADPRTTTGGLIALTAALGLLLRIVTLSESVTLLGIAGAWIGFNSGDGGKQA